MLPHALGRWLVGALLWLAVPSAVAAEKTMQQAKDLTEQCAKLATEPQSRAAGLCEGFVDGFFDMHEFMEVMTGQSLFCPAPDAGRPAFIGAYLGWAAANPDRAGEDSGGALLAALQRAFPCR